MPIVHVEDPMRGEAINFEMFALFAFGLVAVK
jgi:hypothetical protein